MKVFLAIYDHLTKRLNGEQELQHTVQVAGIADVAATDGPLIQGLSVSIPWTGALMIFKLMLPDYGKSIS